MKPTLVLACLGLAYACRSNETHIGWYAESSSSDVMAEARRRLNECDYQSRRHAEKEAAEFLRKNVMPFDLPKLETLGFGSDDSVDVDGLSFGIIQPTVSLALDAKKNYTWTDALPRCIFNEYVLNYANTNEARSNWRSYLTPIVQDTLEQHPATNVAEVVRVLNTHIWTAIAPKNRESIVFVSGQTPLIFDPMSVLTFGYASCTGLAILFTNILRAAGVAARVAGTPAWYGDREQGNHNWVEVYGDDGKWYFLEPSPSAGSVDTLDRDPCARWFCHKDRFHTGENSSGVFAARLDKNNATVAYPLAWEWNSTDVPGVDRSVYYIEQCSRC